MAEPTIVIGGGPTGLGAALHLDGDWLLFERDGRIGGTCQTDVIDGFAFDHAGHIVFTTDPYVQELIPDLLGDNIHWQTRESWVYSKDVFTRYPFQANTYGLPVEVIKECLLGLIDATYAPQDGPPPANFEEWIVRTFGHGIADHFMLPYNRKVWATPLTMMSYDWIERPRHAAPHRPGAGGRAPPRGEGLGPQRALRLPAARRLPGLHGRPHEPPGR